MRDIIGLRDSPMRNGYIVSDGGNLRWDAGARMITMMLLFFISFFVPLMLHFVPGGMDDHCLVCSKESFCYSL